MANITQGLNQSNTIYLSTGSTTRIIEANSVIYKWAPVGGTNKKAINGVLSEDWFDSHLAIEVSMINERNNLAGVYIDTNFLFNTFLPSKTKQYKEYGWSSYIDIVLDMEEVIFANFKDVNCRADLVLKFLKKTPGLTF